MMTYEGEGERGEYSFPEMFDINDVTKNLKNIVCNLSTILLRPQYVT